jgi:hypothetical protein
MSCEIQMKKQKVEIAFRPYVGHKPTVYMSKGWREYAPQLIENFVKWLAEENGGKKVEYKRIPVEDDDGNIAYYRPEMEAVDVVDYSVLDGKIFVDWVNAKVIADADLVYVGLKLADLYSIKKACRVKKVAKVEGEEKATRGPNGEVWYVEHMPGDETNAISHMDKNSWKCAGCGKVWGYKNKAKNCSYSHIAYGLMEGDMFSAGIKGIVKVG